MEIAKDAQAKSSSDEMTGSPLLGNRLCNLTATRSTHHPGSAKANYVCSALPIRVASNPHVVLRDSLVHSDMLGHPGQPLIAIHRLSAPSDHRFEPKLPLRGREVGIAGAGAGSHLVLNNCAPRAAHDGRARSARTTCPLYFTGGRERALTSKPFG